MSDDNIFVRYVFFCIDDIIVMIFDGCKDYLLFLVWMYIYVEDVDKMYELVLSKGVELVYGFRDEFYGDCVSIVKDFVGNIWWIVIYKFIFKCFFSGNKECKVDVMV